MHVKATSLAEPRSFHNDVFVVVAFLVHICTPSLQQTWKWIALPVCRGEGPLPSTRPTAARCRASHLHQAALGERNAARGLLRTHLLVEVPARQESWVGREKAIQQETSALPQL